jgi:hypothetical protein
MPGGPAYASEGSTFMHATDSSYENPISPAFSPSRFYMAFLPMSWVRSQAIWARRAMSLETTHEQHLRDLGEHLRSARTVTPGLMTDLIARACLRFPTHPSATKARVTRLVESGAFCDAALALLALELPQWNLRRLVYEDGEWICSLSRQPGLPAELDEMAEAHHESLPLAILSAFVEARHHSLARREDGPKSVPQVRPTRGYLICCDNFA